MNDLVVHAAGALALHLLMNSGSRHFRINGLFPLKS